LVWARDEHDKENSFEQQLNPGYPVDQKRILLGNQDKWVNFVPGFPIDSYFRTHTHDQYNIRHVFQALRSYEYELVQEHKEK